MNLWYGSVESWPWASPLCSTDIYNNLLAGLYLSGGGYVLPKFMPISFFRRGISFWGLFFLKRKILVKPECYPVLALNRLKLCKFVSRSDLVLDFDYHPPKNLCKLNSQNNFSCHVAKMFTGINLTETKSCHVNFYRINSANHVMLIFYRINSARMERALRQGDPNHMTHSYPKRGYRIYSHLHD